MLLFPDRTSYLSTFCRDKVCVEVGVQRGCYAEQILQLGQPACLHLIDPWHPQPVGVYVDSGNVTDEKFAVMYREVEDRFREHTHVQLWRMLSQDAVKRFEDNSVDFVYLDGNHRVKYVLQDLRAWWRKLKPGGWLCGHDYRARTTSHKGKHIVLEVGAALKSWLPSVGKSEVDMVTETDDSYGIQKPQVRKNK